MNTTDINKAIINTIYGLKKKIETDRTWYLVANPEQYRAVWIYNFDRRNGIDLALRLSKLAFPLWLSIERVFDADGQYVDDSIVGLSL